MTKGSWLEFDDEAAWNFRDSFKILNFQVGGPCNVGLALQIPDSLVASDEDDDDVSDPLPNDVSDWLVEV